MDQPTSTFERIIKEDRVARESKIWRGTLIEYLEVLKKDPTIPRLAHARLYDTIQRAGTAGITDIGDGAARRLYKDEPVKVYNFFKDEFFGIEKTIAQIVRYFHAASLKGEESRQVLYLMGPVGSGKSSLVERLQRGLESSDPSTRSRTARCSRSPLHLIPRHLRKEFEKMIGVHIEGDLCPVCRYRLKEEFGGRYEEVPGGVTAVLQAQPRRHRCRSSGRPQQPGHLGADRLGGHLQARPLLRRRPPSSRSERRAQRRQPRHGASSSRSSRTRPSTCTR